MGSILKKTITLNLFWTFIIIFVIISACCFLFIKYHLDYNTKDALDYATKIMLFFLAFFTFLYHLHNLENQIKTQKESNRQNLAKYTYDICADFRKPPMMDIIETSRALLESRKSQLNNRDKINKFIKYIDKKPEERKCLTLLINYFESISAMVLANDLNDEIVKRLFGNLFIIYYNRLKYYIEYKQQSAPKSWANFERLSKKWIEENKKI
jgi:lipoprotein